jgi:hypothetical protein
MKNLLSTFLLLASLSMPIAHAMRNGKAAPQGAYQGVGFIFPACTGTLITPNTVITANHCLLGPNTLLFTTFTINNKTYKVTKFKVLSASLNRELALLRLDSSVSGMEFIHLASHLPAPKDLVTGVGFGATGSFSSIPGRGDKQVGTFRVAATPMADWQDHLPAVEMISVKSIGASGPIPCAGDSGGPLFSQHGELLGIVSFGKGLPNDKQYENRDESTDRCIKTLTVNYVTIAPNLNWIHQTLKEFDP